jgi:hypothetical protein
MLLRGVGKIKGTCSVQLGGGPGATGTIFSLNTAAWYDGGDPAGGVRTVWSCRARVNCYDTTSGLSYWTGHWRWTRTPGPGVGGFIYYSDATSGLTFAIATSSTTAKIQVTETVGHLVLVDGEAEYEVRW